MQGPCTLLVTVSYAHWPQFQGLKAAEITKPVDLYSRLGHR